MNRSQTNNNPVNLRFANQSEAKGQDDKGFAIFTSAPAGFRAGHRQVQLDTDRGLTVREFINKFAPPNENNTSAYLEFVCKELSVAPDDFMKAVSRYAIVGVMAQMEGFYAQGG